MTDGTDGGGGSGPIRVMVVDDHPMWRDAVARDLAEAGFDVVATAGDGEQAVRRARAAAPDVLVLDLNLPGKPGVQVCKELVGARPGAAGAGAVGQRRARRRPGGGEVRRHRLPAEVRRPRRSCRTRCAARPSATRCSRPGLAGLVLGEYRRLASEPGARRGRRRAQGARS